MQIHLLRHGDYLSATQDPQRGLSPEGREAIQIAGRALDRLGAGWDHILTSPKTRARQTAELVALAVRFPPDEIIESESLLPESPPTQALDLIRQKGGDRLLLVGHLPSLGLIASILVSGGREADIHFQPGTACRIDAARAVPGSGELVWHLTPEAISLMVA